jgi:hypothetical protein
MPLAVVVAQDLPPEVLLLSRVKRHIHEELQQLPNISCLETIEREYQPAHGKMRRLDTVRLEVLANGDSELFASPGERRFSSRHPISYVGSGMLGEGFFGLYLKTVLFGYASHEYKGEEEIGGRRLARYDYRLPRMVSGQTITSPEGSGQVGLRGSYWAEAETGDVLRLEINAEDFPPTLPTTEMAAGITYARTRLSDNLTVLLPGSADVRMVKSSGEIHHDRIGFTHCHVFGAESTISFEAVDSAKDAPHFAVASTDETLRSLPGDLQIAVKLHSPITGDMAVGALIDGEVLLTVARKGKGPIPAGSPVRGRIRRLERYTQPSPYFIVALEFTEIEVQGVRHRFDADIVQIDPPHELGTTLSFREKSATSGHTVAGELTTRSWETATTHDLPGVATFFVRGSSLDLRPGLHTVWRTRPLTP